MDLSILDQKLKNLQKNKVVTSFDDLIFISNVRATINNIQAISITIESNPENDEYKAELTEKLTEFQQFFEEQTLQKLENLNIDIDEFDESVESKKKKSYNTKKEKSLKDVMREIALASKNFKGRKKSSIKINVQQGKGFDKPKNDDFLKAPASSPMVAKPSQELQQSFSSPMQFQPQFQSQPSFNNSFEVPQFDDFSNTVSMTKSDKIDKNLDQKVDDIPKNNNVETISNDEDYLNLNKDTKKEKSVANSRGRDFVFNLLKSKNK